MTKPPTGSAGVGHPDEARQRDLVLRWRREAALHKPYLPDVYHRAAIEYKQRCADELEQCLIAVPPPGAVPAGRREADDARERDFFIGQRAPDTGAAMSQYVPVVVRFRLPDGREFDCRADVREEYAGGQEWWWTEGNGGCDCNRSLYLSREHGVTWGDAQDPDSDEAELPCGETICLVSLIINGRCIESAAETSHRADA